MISAKIIADSKNEFGQHLTTVIVTFPRIILAENNTHRMISKNSASSRAIPYRKMVETMFEGENLRFTPVAWQKDHSGMQGHEYFTDPIDIKECQEIWDEAAFNALKSSEKLSTKGVTKQLCNRLLEPFMWCTVIVTGSEWENFFHLRCPQYLDNMLDGSPNLKDKPFRSRKDYSYYVTDGGKMMDKHRTDLEWRTLNKGLAEIHMMDLAEVIWDAYSESIPKELKAGEWHIPFGDKIDLKELFRISGQSYHENYVKSIYQEGLNKAAVKIATARCARVSYTVVGEEGKADNYDNDIKLHDRLSKSGHWSPFEHCAKAMSREEYYNHVHGVVSCTNNQLAGQDEIQQISLIKEESFGWSGNLRGFIQYRKMFKNENVTK